MTNTIWLTLAECMPPVNEPVWVALFNYGEGGCVYAERGYCDLDGNWYGVDGMPLSGSPLWWSASDEKDFADTGLVLPGFPHVEAK